MKKIQTLFLSILTCSALVAQHIPTIIGGKGVSATLTTEGKVLAWGQNNITLGTTTVSTGILGVGSSAMLVPVPTQVIFPVGVTIKEIGESSGFYFLALSCEGNVYGWGDNSSGQLGLGTSGTIEIAPKPVKVLAGSAVDLAGFRDPANGNLRKVKKVCAGGTTSYAVTEDGRLLSWGNNTTAAPNGFDATGMLGNGSTVALAVNPVFVIDGANSQPLQNVLNVSAGDNEALALVNVNQDGTNIGTVYSWGTGNYGSIGRNAAGTGNSGSENTPSNVARPVRFISATAGANGDGLLSDIKSIAAGDVAGYALDTKGYVWAWGNGAWGGLTGQGTTIAHSDPRRVLKGVVTGKGTDGKYLLARTVSAGLGFAAAVTKNGMPVSWGNNTCTTNGPSNTVNLACGGNLGNNASTVSNQAPLYVQFGAGNVHNNVLNVICTATGGFYIKSDNTLWAWGDNAVGQIGDGSNTTRNRAVQLSLPVGNTLLAPSPMADFAFNDTTVCASKLAGSITLQSGLNVGTVLIANYKFTWYKGTVLGSPSLASDTVAGNIVKSGIGNAFNTYAVINPGTYWLKVEYLGADKPCRGFRPYFASTTVNVYPVSFTAKTNIQYCGNTASLSVNSNNPSVNPVYHWYANATTSTSLGKTVGISSESFDVSSIAAVPNGDKVIYLEERYSATGTTIPTEPSTVFNDDIAAQIVGSNARDMYFYVGSDLTLDTISIYAKTFVGNPASFTFNASIFGSKQECGGRTVADRANVLATGPTIAVIVNPTLTLVKIPVKISLKAGSYYFLGLNSNLQGTIRTYSGVAGITNGQTGLAGNTPKVDNVTGNELKIYGTDDGDCLPSGSLFGSFFNWKFSVAQKYCDRIPVVLKLECPCSKPRSVTITSSPSAIGSPKKVVTGTSATLSGAYVAGTNPIISLIKYVWYKKGSVIGTYSNVPVLSKVLVSKADTGTWILRVEDGDLGNPGCYNEDSIKFNYDVTTGASMDILENNVSTIYPNPFKDNLTFQGSLKESVIRLMDYKGAVVLEHKFVDDIETVSTLNLPAGLYIAQFVKNGQIRNYKVCKE